METVGEKFRPLVKGGPLWTEKYVITFKCTEPAPPCDGSEWCSPLYTCPIDVMLDVVIFEGLDVCAECGGTIGIIIHLFHMSLMPFFETNSTTSVCFSGIVV